MKKIIALLCLSASSYAMAYDGLPKLYQTETDALLHKNSTEIFGLVPYDDNYVMMTESNGNFAYPKKMQHDEVKFQISLAVPFWRGILGKNSVLAGAYTQTSWFQMFNTKDSSPFRETNYKPQLFLAWELDYPIWHGWKMDEFESGFLHDSNGRDNSDNKSRSWNRIYGRISFSKDNWRIQLKPWWRIPESHSSDDNPDIQDYMGHGDLIIDYYTETHQVHLKTHYNPRSGKGGAELSYSYPISRYVRLYAQYYGGYGESLLDYNKNIQRIGIGVSLNNVF